MDRVRGTEPASGAAGHDEPTGGLRRTIGPGLLFFFVLGDMLGGGIYALVGEVGGVVGGAIWVPFLVAFVLASLTAAAYVELVTKYPRAAGAALYVNTAFGRPFLTFLVAFAVMCSGITSAAALARAFAGDYLVTFVDTPVQLGALGLLVVLAAVNLWGVKESVRVNAAFTVIEVVGVLIILTVGAMAIGGGSADLSRNLDLGGDGPPLLLVLAGSALAFYTLIGFEDSVNMAEEVQDPSRAFPRALFGAMGVAAVAYLGVTVVTSAVVPTQDLATSDAPLLEVIRRGPGGVPETLFSGIALFALANGALLSLMMASRLVYGMAQEGIVPSALGRVLPGRRTPVVAITFTTALALVLAATGDLGDLADTTVLLLLVVFAFVNVSVLVLRGDDVGHDHFRAPTLAPALGAVVCVALVTQHEGATWLRAAALMTLGVVVWGIDRAIDHRTGTHTGRTS